MSKHETPLTRRYWKEIGGTLIEEFLAVKKTKESGQRLIDGVIIMNGENIVSNTQQEIKNKDIIIIQTKAKKLSMSLLGQALFSREILTSFKPKSIRTVAICTKNDQLLEELAIKYDINVIVYQNT